eukprot:s89_g30.t1
MAEPVEDGPSGQLTMESLVTISEDLEPYVLEWPDLHTMDGHSEGFVLVVLKRTAGVLLAVPSGFIPEDLLVKANRGEDAGIVGASTVLELPGVLVEDGRQAPIGSSMQVVVVDMGAEIVDQMRLREESEIIAFNFDPENPFAIPSPQDLLSAAMEWIEAAGEESGLAFYSAGSIEQGLVEDPPDGETPHSAPVTPAQRQKRPKPGATTTRDTKSKPKNTRPTTASLAASMDKLLELVPNLSSQIQTLAERQGQLEGRMSATAKATTYGLSQPLAQSVAERALPADALTRVLATPPPKTRQAASAGILQDSLFAQPQELLALEEEKVSQPTLAGDNLAKAVYAQSQALTALVGQIANNSVDPMMDLASSSGASASTRGGVGRAKLQAELASHSGSFYMAVLRAMARRMQPTSSALGTPLELLQRGISGPLYMERFGGFGKQRDLGMILYQIMGIMEFLQADNIGAAKDATALLAVAIDQAVLDGGKFDLASLLTLQEEPPSTIYVHRQQSSLARARAFSPLADQRWVTVALAFLKELDVITSKRLELTASGPGAKPAGGAGDPNPKTRPAPKRKGKGGGKQGNKGQDNQHEGEEDQ